MNAELIEKYSQPIEDAVDYIEGRRTRVSPKPWKPEQRKKWKLRFPKCPLCNEEYSKANPLTKEHIHPTVLGGYDRDSNIIPLCEKCNFARNNVMMTVLGTSVIKIIRKRWPKIKPSIQRFIIWCHASIYSNKDDLNQCPDLNLKFSRERKITYPFSSNVSQTPTSTKKKLSLWERAGEVGRNAMKSASKSIKSLKPVTKTHQKEIEESEKIVLQCQGQGCEQQLRIPSDHTGNFRCPKCKHEHLGKDSSLPIEEFQRIILDHLELEPILGSELGKKVAIFMEIRGHSKCNTTEFLKLFGIPRGFKKAIEKHLEGLVIITGTGAGYSIAKIKQSNPKKTLLKEKDLQKELSSHNIVAFRTKILELLPSEKIPLVRFATNIEAYMKSIGYESSHVTEFLKLFELPRGLKKAIEKHMSKEVIVSGEAPKYFVQKKVS